MGVWSQHGWVSDKLVHYNFTQTSQASNCYSRQLQDSNLTCEVLSRLPSSTTMISYVNEDFSPCRGKDPPPPPAVAAQYGVKHNTVSSTTRCQAQHGVKHNTVSSTTLRMHIPVTGSQLQKIPSRNSGCSEHNIEDITEHRNSFQPW